MMTVRECYRRIALFQKAEYIPNFEGSISPETEQRWHAEGLPEGVSWYDFFGIDRHELVRSIEFGPVPGVAELGESPPATPYGPAVRDRWGRVCVWPQDERFRHLAHVILRGALQDRADWEAMKDQFRPDVASRYPADWDARVRKWRGHEHVMMLEAPSMVGDLRMEMGFENYCMKLYDDRKMVEDLMEARTELGLRILDKALKEVDFDMLWFWEDCAYRNGPIISPAIFEELAAPRYRRLTEWYKSRGGEIVSVDSDGDVRALIPGWLKGGINHIWPLEPFAGMDVVALRKEYGQAFSMRGGVDKHVVAKGKDAIDRELERVCPVVQDGGFIPHLDHQMPDCSFEDICYYMERKHELLGSRPNCAKQRH